MNWYAKYLFIYRMIHIPGFSGTYVCDSIKEAKDLFQHHKKTS